MAALTADQIQTRIDTLQAAMDAGVLIVQSGTDRVQYNSYSDLSKALARLKAQLVTAQGGTPRSRVNYVTQESKGFGHGPNGLKDFS